jgi:hypothetical protein
MYTWMAAYPVPMIISVGAKVVNKAFVMNLLTFQPFFLARPYMHFTDVS